MGASAANNAMTITFLGTGPAISIPRPGHTDAVCRDARRRGSKSARLRSSVLIEDRGTRILIDAGPDVLVQLKRIPIHTLDAVFITHPHADAMGGVHEIVFHQKELRSTPVPLAAERLTYARISRSIIPVYFEPYQFLSFLRLIPIAPFKSYRIAKVMITPFRVLHAFDRQFPTLGFAFDKQFAYASDVARIPAKSMRLLRGTQTLVLDATMWLDRKMPFHLNTAEAIMLGRELGVRHLYLTQIGHGYPPHDRAQREIDKFCKKEQIVFPVILPYDGLTIKI